MADTQAGTPVSTWTVTSSERPHERIGDDYPPCCGLPPTVLHWKKKGFVAIVCQNEQCPNHVGVLCYGHGEAPARWASFLPPPITGDHSS